jgi:hypothetical protein
MVAVCQAAGFEGIERIVGLVMGMQREVVHGGRPADCQPLSIFHQGTDILSV